MLFYRAFYLFLVYTPPGVDDIRFEPLIKDLLSVNAHPAAEETFQMAK
ncbi:MAG: hypothetical protein JWP81_4981 [Ferruginibacter sp.]|nr:hypothetical protein [Ferruginibacter sp.]